MLSSKILLIYGFLTFALSLVVTRLMMWMNVQDIPGDRSSHTIVTPRSGGVGLVSALVIILVAAYTYGTFHGLPPKPVLVVLSSSLFMALVGFLDDLKGVRWLTKLMAQTILALTVVMSGVTLKTISLPYFGSLSLGLAGDIVAVLWIISLTNAFNFMDGINGISGGVALVVCIALTFLISSDSLMLFLVGILPFALLGFLCFNFPQGRVFLGDVGSQFLGFLFACLGLLLPLKESGISVWIMPLLFSLYLFDTGVTVVRRWLKKANISMAHRDHLYQLLVRSGWSHTRVTLLYCTFFALQGGVAYMVVQTPQVNHWILFIPLVAFYIAFAMIVMKYAKSQGVEL